MCYCLFEFNLRRKNLSPKTKNLPESPIEDVEGGLLYGKSRLRFLIVCRKLHLNMFQEDVPRSYGNTTMPSGRMNSRRKRKTDCINDQMRTWQPWINESFFLHGRRGTQTDRRALSIKEKKTATVFGGFTFLLNPPCNELEKWLRQRRKPVFLNNNLSLHRKKSSKEQRIFHLFYKII